MSGPDTPPNGRNYAVLQRLRLIDFLLEHYGRINRDSLMDYFGISLPQASHDFAAYQKAAPGNMQYDARQRAYVATAYFKREFP